MALLQVSELQTDEADTTSSRYHRSELDVQATGGRRHDCVVHTGTSRGFGAQIAKEALAQGHQVVATARNPDTVTAAFPSAAALLADPLDVTNAAEAASAATAAVDHFGRIDVLVTIVEPGYF
jgi:NADP-dependent 3-hydroxy acid dehydrogenase YdfG